MTLRQLKVKYWHIIQFSDNKDVVKAISSLEKLDLTRILREHEFNNIERLYRYLDCLVPSITQNIIVDEFVEYFQLRYRTRLREELTVTHFINMEDLHDSVEKRHG